MPLFTGKQNNNNNHTTYNGIFIETWSLKYANSQWRTYRVDWFLAYLKCFMTMKSNKQKPIVEPPNNLALEIIFEEEDYSYTVDYWCLGTMLYGMITGVTPFATSTPDEMFDRVLYDNLISPLSLWVGSQGFNRWSSWTWSNALVGYRWYIWDQTASLLYWPFKLESCHHKTNKPLSCPAVSSQADLTLFDPDFLCLSTDLTETTDCPCSSADLAKDAFTGYSFINNQQSTINNNQ